MIILNYHEISEAHDRDNWTLSPSQFDLHFSVFKDRIITPHEFLSFCHDHSMANTSRVLITFDDARESDFLFALPRLLGAGFISFVPTSNVGRPGYLTPSMIREMQGSGVMIGSHSVSHADLTRLDRSDLLHELRDSKEYLESILGQSINLLAFPYGRFNRRVWDLALEIGYTHLFTTQLGWHNGFEKFLFSRLCVTQDMNASFISSYLEDPCFSRSLAWRLSQRVGVYRYLMRLRFH